MYAYIYIYIHIHMGINELYYTFCMRCGAERRFHQRYYYALCTMHNAQCTIHYIILHYITLHYIILCYVMLCYVMLYTILYYTILYYTILYYTILCHILYSILYATTRSALRPPGARIRTRAPRGAPRRMRAPRTGPRSAPALSGANTSRRVIFANVNIINIMLIYVPFIND